MAGPLYLHADPSWSSHLWVPAVVPSVAALQAPGTGPTTETLLRRVASSWDALPLTARLALFVRGYLQVLLTAACGAIIVLLSTSAALVTHFFLVWMGVAAMLKLGDPPFVMVMLVHVPALRVSSWLGAMLARTLADGVADRNREWRALVLAELAHRLALTAHPRRSLGACSSSVGLPVFEGPCPRQRIEPRLF